VNAKRELVFANPEAFETCAMWNLGSDVARRMNSRAVFAIPPLFLETYEELLAEHYALALTPGNHLGGLRRKLAHPEQPGLRADLSLVAMDDPLLTRPYLFAQLINHLGAQRAHRRRAGPPTRRARAAHAPRARGCLAGARRPRQRRDRDPPA